jgi:hypothetical protein
LPPLDVGLILGAFLWGISADIIGRRFSWNATLVVPGVFGIIASASVNFTMFVFSPFLISACRHIIWPLVVNFSCPEDPDISEPDRTICELGTNDQNKSWRYGSEYSGF